MFIVWFILSFASLKVAPEVTCAALAHPRPEHRREIRRPHLRAPSVGERSKHAGTKESPTQLVGQTEDPSNLLPKTSSELWRAAGVETSPNSAREP